MGLFSSIGSLLGSNPYDDEEGVLKNVPGMFEKALGPYMSEGKNLLPTLNNQFMYMMHNPSVMLQALGSSYHHSPTYKYMLDQGIAAANRGANATGMGGSTGNQVQLEKLGQNMANKDYQQYLHNALGVMGQGMTGLSGLENQGFNATQSYAGGMGNYYNNLAQMAGASAQANANRGAGMIALLAKSLGG